MPTKANSVIPLTYKGKPLVRNNNTIYYGDMNDKYVALLQIVSNKPFEDMEVADKVTVQILSTDPTLSMRERVWKKSEKDGLYEALNIASIWLERALAN